MASYNSSDDESSDHSFTGECAPCNDVDGPYFNDESYSSYHDESYESSERSVSSFVEESNEHEDETHVEKPHKRHHKKMINVVYHHVTFGKRTVSHDSDILTGGHCIFIDGVEAPRLIIRPGNTYIFKITQEGDKHTFILTTNRVGKNDHGIPVLPINGAPQAMSRGDYVYTATVNTPISFYYNSTKDTWYGNAVVCTPKLVM